MSAQLLISPRFALGPFKFAAHLNLPPGHLIPFDPPVVENERAGDKSSELIPVWAAILVRIPFQFNGAPI